MSSMSVEAVGGLFAKLRASFGAVLASAKDRRDGVMGGVERGVDGFKPKIGCGEGGTGNFGAELVKARATSPFSPLLVEKADDSVVKALERRNLLGSSKALNFLGAERSGAVRIDVVAEPNLNSKLPAGRGRAVID